MKFTTRHLIWIVAILAVVVVVVLAFQPRPIVVDSDAVRRGTLVATVVDDGITRVRERYKISAPIQGRLIRTPLRAGDALRKGETIVAEFLPTSPSPLDARSVLEAQARLDQAAAAVREAEAREQQARSDSEYFAAERVRAEKLVAQGIRTEEAADRAKRDDESAREALRAANFSVEMARFGKKLAEASLGRFDPAADAQHRETTGQPESPTVRLSSPVDGQVLRVFEESARTLAAGTPILEVGDVGTLEIVADFLSQDAVRVTRGMRVQIRGWDGDRTSDTGAARALRGVVRLVEPSGFTKISALGVEEQRVNIIIDPDQDPKAWAPMGDGFRVEAHIELWRGDDVLLVPAGALFPRDDGSAVFVIDGGAARLQEVKIGHRSGLQAEVLGGLAAGDKVILYPSELIRAGTAVTDRR